MQNLSRPMKAIAALLLVILLTGFMANSNQTPQVLVNGKKTLGSAINTSVTLYTASGTATFTGSISGQVLTVASGLTGTMAVGQQVTCATCSQTVITAVGTGTGGVGTYLLSAPQTVASTTMTAFGNGAKMTGCTVSSSDSSAHVVTILIAGVPQTSFTVPASGGNVFTATNCMAAQNWGNSLNAGGLPVDNNGNAYFPLMPGDTVIMQFATALGSGGLYAAVFAGE